MRARKLVKNDETKKHDIVWFGCYGVAEGERAKASMQFEEAQASEGEETLLCSESTICSSSTVLPLRSGTWVGLAQTPLYLSDDPLAELTVSCSGYSGDYTIVFNCKAITESGSTEFFKQFAPTGSSTTISIKDELWEDLKSAKFTSCCCMGVILSEAPQENTEFWVEYPTIKSKLTYDASYYSSNKKTPSYEESKAFNYSSKQESVKDALIPRLSVIQGELWYKPSYGLPLLGKVKSKGIYDSIITSYIADYPDVSFLEEFTSTVEGHSYKYDAKILTTFGEVAEISVE